MTITLPNSNARFKRQLRIASCYFVQEIIGLKTFSTS